MGSAPALQAGGWGFESPWLHQKCLTGTRDIGRCGVFPFRFLTFVAAVVCFAKDGGERLCERGAELFVVGDVQARVERMVRQPPVGVVWIGG